MKVKYDLDDILSLLICSEAYGFSNEMIYMTLLSSIKLTEKRIDKYIEDNYSSEDYSDEDRKAYKDFLIEISEKYT